MAEKQPEYAEDPTATDHHTETDHHTATDHHYHADEASKIEARRGSKVNEASDLYGDVQTAEEYGYVSRG
jgi:yeast amino acid transporter